VEHLRFNFTSIASLQVGSERGDRRYQVNCVSIPQGALTLTDCRVYPVKPGDHKPEALRATFNTSLEKLSPNKVRILYLHAPDRSVPFEETLAEVDKLHKEGLLYARFIYLFIYYPYPTSAVKYSDWVITPPGKSQKLLPSARCITGFNPRYIKGK